jgi:hypothetical protein
MALSHSRSYNSTVHTDAYARYKDITKRKSERERRKEQKRPPSLSSLLHVRLTTGASRLALQPMKKNTKRAQDEAKEEKERKR